MRLYALEGLLARLAVSRYAAQLVLKGGVLLAAYGTRRATRDIDLQARQVTNELGNVLSMIQEIAGIAIEDGLTYAAEAATAHAIRQDDTYQGVRVALVCSLVSARISLRHRPSPTCRRTARLAKDSPIGLGDMAAQPTARRRPAGLR
jgi:hypothetical protein